MIVLMLAVLMVAGCSGLIANAKYSALIDATVAVSDTATTRAVAGDMSGDDMVRALQADNTSWHNIQNAKNGTVAK